MQVITGSLSGYTSTIYPFFKTRLFLETPREAWVLVCPKTQKNETQPSENIDTTNDDPRDTTSASENGKKERTVIETVLEPSVPITTAKTTTPEGGGNTNKKQPTPTKRTSETPKVQTILKNKC